jgi:hypothetical protein
MTLSRSQKKKIIKRVAHLPPRDDLSLFATLLKVDEEQRIVEGIASTDALDMQPGIWQDELYQGDSITPEAIEAALPDYMRWANVREMHQPSAVGITLMAKVLDTPLKVEGKLIKNALFVRVKVVDDDAWKKVKAGVYKGFSIGGKFIDGVLKKTGGLVYRLVTKLRMTEISLADRPANPDAKILLWKGDNLMPNQILQTPDLAELLLKATDPAKVVTMLQALRNQAELEGDMDTAELYTSAIKTIQQAAGEAKPAEGAEPRADEESEKPETPVAAAAGAEQPEQKPDAALAMAAKVADLAKAGRTFSSGNATALHAAIQTMAKALAAAGDETAAKIMACYPEEATAKVEGVTPKTSTPEAEALMKVLTPMFKAHEDRVAGILAKTEDLAKQVDTLMRQPAPGGPAMRPAEKTLAGQSSPAATASAQATEQRQTLETRVSDLRRSVATEPNPFYRNQYQQDLTKAEADLAACK